jgi:hypothetical protein
MDPASKPSSKLRPPSSQDASTRPKRRGRPPGSVSLTRPVWETIVAYIRAGAWDHVAAEAARISPRTFQDWMARGEGRHPTRPSTPKLRAFARDVNQARAQARLVAETAVFRDRPWWWLSHVARSEPGRAGWSEPRSEVGRNPHAGSLQQAIDQMTDEELEGHITRLVEALVDEDPPTARPRQSRKRRNR